MGNPIVIDIPHRLRRTEAKRRIAQGAERFTAIVPGSSIVSNQWQGDTLTLGIEAFAQKATAILTVLDDRVHATFELPLFLGGAADRLRHVFFDTGQKLLR
jgi:hypothetical protein